MVKKTVVEERLDGLEQSFEGLSLEVRSVTTELRTEFREWMERLELRLPRKIRRRRAGSSTVVNEDDEEAEDSAADTETTSEASAKPRHHYRGRKLEIPVFEGDEAYEWLVKVEHYFTINGVEEEMLKVVVIALDGQALNWYQCWEEQHPEPCWEEFKQAVI